MAKEYYATTLISYGKKIEDKDDPTKPARIESTEFKVGQRVTGLSTDEMKQLWDAGALEERDASDSSSSESTEDQEQKSVETASPVPATPASSTGQTPATGTKSNPTPSQGSTKS